MMTMTMMYGSDTARRCCRLNMTDRVQTCRKLYFPELSVTRVRLHLLLLLLLISLLELS